MKKLLSAIIFAIAILPNTFGQNVGIGTANPQSKLHVNGEARADSLIINPGAAISKAIEVQSVGAETLDQQNNIFSNNCSISYDQNSAWQSFTAGASGLLSKVKLKLSFSNGGNPRTLNIYSGTGNSGALLISIPFAVGTTLANPFQDSPPLNIPVTAGNIYTIELTDKSGWLSCTNTYGAGFSSIGNNIDYDFTTYVSSINTTFLVSKQGKTTTTNLQISNTGTIYNKTLSGQNTLGSGTLGVNNFTITFPSSFTGIPKVTATLETTNVNDVFTTSVKQISATSFVVQVYRIDIIGGSWGQSLKVNWSAWE